MDKEIRFLAYLQSEGSNRHRKLCNFYKSIGSLKQLVYQDYTRGMITMKHNNRELFGFNISNFKSKYVNNECD